MSQALLEMETPTMVITWPRDLLRQIESMAQRRGVEADILVVEAVEQYLKQPEEVSEARKKLGELLKHMDTSGDMLETLREVRQKASETIRAHQDWFDMVAAGGATRKKPTAMPLSLMTTIFKSLLSISQSGLRKNAWLC